MAQRPTTWDVGVIALMIVAFSARVLAQDSVAPTCLTPEAQREVGSLAAQIDTADGVVKRALAAEKEATRRQQVCKRTPPLLRGEPPPECRAESQAVDQSKKTWAAALETERTLLDRSGRLLQLPVCPQPVP